MSDQIVTINKAVFITYSIRDAHGEILEQSDIPLGYVHGADSGLLEQVEAKLQGKSVGDKIEVFIPSDQAYGPHLDELTFTDDIDNVPPQFRHIGAQVEMQNKAGDSKMFTVSRIEDGKLTVDGNHPMAGKDLIFTVSIIDIRDATAAEIANGRPDDTGLGGSPTIN
jgi:FKBP-type peptidyl-prolyl cis-trans isomerase SlyD